MAGFLKNILPVVLASVILVYLSSVYGEEVKVAQDEPVKATTQGSYTLTLSGAINDQRSGTVAYVGKGTSGGYNLMKFEFAETQDEREKDYRLTFTLASSDDLERLPFPMPGNYAINKGKIGRGGLTVNGEFDAAIITEDLDL